MGEAGASRGGWWEGLWKVDLAAAVNVDNAEAEDPHLGDDADDSDIDSATVLRS